MNANEANSTDFSMQETFPAARVVKLLCFAAASAAVVEAADGYGFAATVASQSKAAGMQEFPYPLRECEEIIVCCGLVRHPETMRFLHKQRLCSEA